MKRLIIALNITMAAVTAMAFRAEEWPREMSAGSNTVTRSLDRLQQKPSIAQRAAARRLAAAHIDWSRKTGVPASIRGKQLGEQRSGGKGLSAAKHGRYAEAAVAVMDSLSDLYRLKDARREFAVRQEASDALGYHHVRLAQSHEGLRVIGGDVRVHFDSNGDPYQVNGAYIPGIEVNIAPALSADKAAVVARDDLSARGKPPVTGSTAPELVVYALSFPPKLAYELTLAFDTPRHGAGRWRYWVDANNGAVLNAFDSVPTIAPPSYNGSPALITGALLPGEGGALTNVYGWHDTLYQAYYLFNNQRHWIIYNATDTGYPDVDTYAWRATNDWGTSDCAEVSAAVSFDAIQTYFRQVHNCDSFDRSGAQALANVHVGKNYVNAYWDSVDFHFGDGDGLLANALTVIDVAAHEFTHAVTDYSAELYYQDESGALNESFSDIFSALVEFNAQPDGRAAYPGKNSGCSDWLMGEDCWLASTALRDMRDPSSSVTLEKGSQQPSRYEGTHWYSGASDNGGVHINSGVQNFFFYLLAEGGSGVNDGLGYSVTGIGITNAAQVAYRALTVYASQYDDYRDIRSAWEAAAEDLNTNWVAGVEAAWSAVGVERNVTGGNVFNDYNGDGATEMALYERATGNWYCMTWMNQLVAWAVNFGANGFLPAPGDYDGCGTTDYAVYRQDNGLWYISFATNGEMESFQLGGPGLIPVPGDYDADGMEDPAVYQPATGNWYIWSRRSGPLAWGLNFGAAGLIPVPGDYNGGGATDLAVYDASSGMWYFLFVETGAVAGTSFGGSKMTPVVGDYDGDGMFDLAVYQRGSGQWYIRSLNGTVLAWDLTLGNSTFIPVPGDYDGRGMSDLAIYSEDTGYWYIQLMESGLIVGGSFGGPGFMPAGVWTW